MRIQIPSFKGIVPLGDPRVLAPEIAVEAVNCRFERGNLEPYKELTTLPTSLNFGAKSIFLYSDIHWLSWNKDVDVILSPVIDDDYNSVIWTGDVEPRIGYNDSVTGSATPPDGFTPLGVPMRENAPITIVDTLDNEQDEFETENDETRFYLYTYVNNRGQESAPSVVSNKVELKNPDATVRLQLPTMDSALTGDRQITDIRIYRTGTTLETSDFYYVTQLPVARAGTTYDDSATELQGTTLDTYNHEPPNEDMIGICAMPNGIACGFFDKTICFSEPYLPYAWNSDNQQATEHKIVALSVIGNSVVVGTEGNPYIFSGVNPSAISGVKLELKQACVSKRSMVDMGDYALYASPDGLVMVTGQSAELITKTIIRRDQWQEKYKPSTIHACHFEGKYIAFYDNSKGFIYDPQTQTLVDLDFYADGTYNDLKNDKLYLIKDNALQVWDDDVVLKPMRWKKRFELNGRTLPCCMRVESDDLAYITVKVWVDGNEVLNTNPASETFWLPPLRGEYFEIEVSGQGVVRGIVLAQSMRELQYG